MCKQDIRIARAAEAMAAKNDPGAVDPVLAIKANPNRYSFSAAVWANDPTQKFAVLFYTPVGGVRFPLFVLNNDNQSGTLNLVDIGQPLTGDIRCMPVAGQHDSGCYGEASFLIDVEDIP